MTHFSFCNFQDNFLCEQMGEHRREKGRYGNDHTYVGGHGRSKKRLTWLEACEIKINYLRKTAKADNQYPLRIVDGTRWHMRQDMSGR